MQAERHAGVFRHWLPDLIERFRPPLQDRFEAQFLGEEFVDPEESFCEL